MIPPATKPPIMVFRLSSFSRRFAAAFRKNIYEPPIAATHHTPHTTLNFPPSIQGPPPPLPPSHRGGGGRRGEEGNLPNVAIVPPVRVTTLNGLTFCFVSVFCTALTNRPAPPRIRVPFVASPIVSRRLNWPGSWCDVIFLFLLSFSFFCGGVLGSPRRCIDGGGGGGIGLAGVGYRGGGEWICPALTFN